MAYLGSQLSDYTRNKRYLLGEEDRPATGGGTPLEPEYDVSDDYRYPGLNRRQVATPRAPSPFSRRAPSVGRGVSSPTPRAPTQTQETQPSPSMAPASAPATLSAPGPAPSIPSYQRTGTLSERLYSPLSSGAQKGQESLGQAAAFFRQEAGPSRTYESTGAEEKLREAYQTGSQPAMEAARGFVGAEYAGPQGLDQQQVAGLQKLTEDLRARQRALGSAGGLQTLIGQSVAGLTPGEALFEAKRRLPESKVEARDLGFEQVNPLVSRLMEERRGAEEFAKQRTGEEADIAAKSRGFLTGERGGITSAIEALMAERAAQQAAAEQAFAGIARPEGGLAAIQAASPYLEGGAETAGKFNTQAMKDKARADALFQEIMADPRFASIAQYDPLELGVGGRGKQFYDIGGEDVRGVVQDPATRKLLYERQQALEAAFDPARGQARVFGRTPTEGGELAQLRPLYHGQEFQPVDPAAYFGFDPGVRPSRENTSSAQQKEQFNRINDLLGELDRIGEAEPFRAAQIFADVDRYLADEESALEAQKGELSAAAKEWRSQVKKMRKSYRKAAKEKAYGKMAGVLGAAVGGKGVGSASSGLGSFFGEFLQHDPLIGGPVQRAAT